jgi:hypothetical protein
MLEWTSGFLVLVIIVAVVLAYFEAVDLFELIGGVLKLTAGLLFAVGAFFVWLVTRRGQEKRPSDARAAASSQHAKPRRAVARPIVEKCL